MAFIIGEAGTNHADQQPIKRLGNALDYVDAAASAGADAIKFQMFIGPNIKQDMFCWIDGDEDRVERWGQSELDRHAWWTVKECAEDRGLMFIASVFQTRGVHMLNTLGVKVIKVASRAAKNFPYEMFTFPTWLLASNGMHIPPDRLGVIEFECEPRYPSTVRWTGSLERGFSDHSGTPEKALDAISRGCKIIEVHFHRKEKDAGPDLPASLTVEELKEVCAK